MYDPLIEKIVSLVVILASFNFTFVCFFNWAETAFYEYISLWESL